MNKKLKTIENESRYEFMSHEEMLSYEQVQAYAKKNRIKSMRQWFAFHNESKGGAPRPRNIPGDPSKYFQRRNKWGGWPSFLGTTTKATQTVKSEFKDLAACKQWFINQKIYTVAQFRELSKSGNRPSEIPAAPNKKYGVKYSDILCPKVSSYVSYEEAKDLVLKFGFKSSIAFREGRKENIDKLGCIPSNPEKWYEGDWVSWPKFLNTSLKKAHALNYFRSLVECKAWFQENKIYTIIQFREMSKKGLRPDDIPSTPDKKYGVKYSELLCDKKDLYLEYEEAKSLVSELNIGNKSGYRKFYKENVETTLLPSNPERIYDKNWISWDVFLN